MATETSILLFYQNLTGANSLGKELSSLPIFKYCVCVWENRNMRGHQQCIIASEWVIIEHKILFYQNLTGANSLGKELSSLPIFKYCVCVWENRNMRGHQQCTIASEWVIIEHKIYMRKSKMIGITAKNKNIHVEL